MLTLNGDNTYTNITLDWTKCDYITNVGETPSLTSALGREPATSARPPDFAKGVASEAAYRIFIRFAPS